MNNESYFTYKSDKFPDPKALTPILVKYKSTTKVPNRLLVWISITDTAISRSFLIERPYSFIASIYQKECIENRLHYFIKHLNCKGDKIIFWSDLATPHYAKTTFAVFNKLCIPFVSKDENPPNLPQRRPIENAWAQRD